MRPRVHGYEPQPDQPFAHHCVKPQEPAGLLQRFSYMPQ